MPVKREGKLSGLRAKLENAQKRSGIESGMIVAQRAQGKAPVDKGRLKRSITHDEPQIVGPMRVRTTVGTNVEYARILELGGQTSPHTIMPKNKKALAFDWPNAPGGLNPSSSGKYVFKSVQHPGSVIKAKPYLKPAINSSKDLIKRIHIKNIVAALKA